MEWYAKLGYMSIGAVLGFFVAALCAMARCGDCETIERIKRGGK